MEFGKRIYPKWLMVIFFASVILLTIYIPSLVFTGPRTPPAPGPHVLLFNISDKVYLYKGKYYKEIPPIDSSLEYDPVKQDFVNLNPVRPVAVDGIDYGRMALQYLALLAAFLPLALVFSKRSHTPENQPIAEKVHDDLYTPHKLLVVSYQLAANTEKKEGMNYKDKQARLTNAIKAQKDFLEISPCIWVVELFQKESPVSFETRLSDLVSPYDRIVVSGLILTALQASEAEIEWINRRLDRI